MPRLGLGVLVLAAVLGSGLAPGRGAAADPDQVPPSQDNPPGCTTATSSGAPACGAQGRDHFANPDHRPPIKACDNVRSPAGSLVARVVPRGPVRADGTLAFTSGACVYLPPGYDTGKLRYPVLYLLHGGGGDEADWVTFGHIQAMLDAAYAADPRHALITVMPDGTDAQWYDSYDGSLLNERYVLDYLVPFVDRHFRTVADRRGRVVDGLSNGGYGSMHLAAKAPDRFVAAGSMSGNVGARAMSGLGRPIVPGAPPLQEASVYYQGNVPAYLAANLDDVDLTIDWGASCSKDVTVDLCATWAFEQSFRFDNQYFRDQLDAVHHRGVYQYRETEGGHAWRWWTAWLRDRHLPFLWRRLAAPEPAGAPPRASGLPSAFRYRSIAPSFSVYGYDVTLARPVREFLDLRDVSSGGLSVQGSGAASVTTAPRYRPGLRYRVVGAGARDLTVGADALGRLRFLVDLGPPHQFEQYSAPQRAQEATGPYWTVRAITISELHEPARVARAAPRPRPRSRARAPSRRPRPRRQGPSGRPTP
jgi:enterochelin esterase-like enzyme